jgi:hypothetical protein
MVIVNNVQDPWKDPTDFTAQRFQRVFPWEIIAQEQNLLKNPAGSFQKVFRWDIIDGPHGIYLHGLSQIGQWLDTCHPQYL